MKKIFTLILTAFLSTQLCAVAQDVATQPAQNPVEQTDTAQQPKKNTLQKVLGVFSDVKVHGLGVMQYNYESRDNTNSFLLRYVRLSLEGRIFKDFFWKIQGQINGNTNNLGSSPRLLDVFVEWQRFSFVKIKVGQYKRPFTFENPLHPVDQGFMSYSQGVTKLAGMSDRVGEHASNGRDIGIQVQGDFLRDGKGRNLVHYEVGVFNGQGINTKDTDKKKDLIGGFWVMPVEGLRIGASGWLGTYTRADVTLDRKRWAFSAEYAAKGWTARAEYIGSKGYGFKTVYQKPADATDTTVDYEAGDRADAFYAMVIAPVIKDHFYLKARYDLYRPRLNGATSRTLYEIGADYEFYKKRLKISAEYARVQDNSYAQPGSNIFDVQFSFRF